MPFNTQPGPNAAEKSALRARARRERLALSDARRREAALLLAGAGAGFIVDLAADQVKDAIVSAYYPVRGEIDCLPLLAALTGRGQRLALPVVRDDAFLDFRLWRPGGPLTPGRFGIPCPADGPVVEPDVLLVPLLAFDGRGHRLGYGAGHYDRVLAALRARRPVAAIGLAYDFQEIAAVPAQDHDQRLDWALTPSGPRRLGD